MDDPKESKVVGKIQYAVPPGRPPFKGCSYNVGAAWAISKFSKHKEEAFKLIAYLSSEEYALRFAHLALYPRGAVVNNPEVIKKYRWYPVALETIKQGKILPRFPEFWEVGDEMAVQIHRYLMGEVSAKVALDAAGQKARAVLREKGYIK
jgi:multiple sugar transport system substrate-binding protein